jgi:hypothetical protein
MWILQSKCEGSSNISQAIDRRVPKECVSSRSDHRTYIEKTFQVRIQFDKSFLTDECYALHETTDLILNGIRENIILAKEKLAEFMAPLKVHRIYMTNQEIKVIISNLKIIKQAIYPGEIRCSRDNALRDINHPFHTIYYKDKEVALVGTEETINEAINAVHRDVTRDKEYLKHSFSLNYLLPECSKQVINEIKVKIEEEYREMGAKLIVYEPQAPRKNVSLTLVANYENFQQVYDALKQMIDTSNILNEFEKFDAYQNKLLYQMNKYFFKYLQNYFQTKSIIFMKTWETIASDYALNCSKYNNSFKMTRGKYIRDHELKFYIISVNRLTQGAGYRELGLEWKDVVLILKSMINKIVLTEPSMSVKNFQTVLNQSSQLREFIDNYKAATYFSEYANEKLIDFEKRLRDKLLDQKEQEEDPDYQYWRRDQGMNPRVYPSDRGGMRFSRTNFRMPDRTQLIENMPETQKLEATISAPVSSVTQTPLTLQNQQSTYVSRLAEIPEKNKMQKDLEFMRAQSSSPSVRNTEDESSSSRSKSEKKDIQNNRKNDRSKREDSSESKDSRKKSRREKVRADFRLMKEKMKARKKEPKGKVSDDERSSRAGASRPRKESRDNSSSSSSSSSKSSSSKSYSSNSRRSRSEKSSRRKGTKGRRRNNSSSRSSKSQESSPVRKVKYTFGGSNQKSNSKTSKSESRSRTDSGSRSKKQKISKFKTSTTYKQERSDSSSSRSNPRRGNRDDRSKRKSARGSSDERGKSRHRRSSPEKSSHPVKRSGYLNAGKSSYLGKR